MGFTIVAKAGGSDEAPENSFEAFGAAARAELPAFARLAFEVDVRLSRDGRLFALHDPTDASASELSKRRVPTLGDVIDVTRGHELVIEPHDSKHGMLERLVDALRCFSLGDRQRLVVASECDGLIRGFRARVPEVRTAATPGEAWRALVCNRLRLERFSASGHLWMLPETHRGIRVVTKRFVEMATRAGDPVWVYVVNDAAHALALRELGVNGCFTTRPRALAHELRLRERGRPSG